MYTTQTPVPKIRVSSNMEAKTKQQLDSLIMGLVKDTVNTIDSKTRSASYIQAFFQENNGARSSEVKQAAQKCDVSIDEYVRDIYQHVWNEQNLKTGEDQLLYCLKNKVANCNEFKNIMTEKLIEQKCFFEQIGFIKTQYKKGDHVFNYAIANTPRDIYLIDAWQQRVVKISLDHREYNHITNFINQSAGFPESIHETIATLMNFGRSNEYTPNNNFNTLNSLFHDTTPTFNIDNYPLDLSLDNMFKKDSDNLPNFLLDKSFVFKSPILTSAHMVSSQTSATLFESHKIDKSDLNPNFDSKKILTTESQIRHLKFLMQNSMITLDTVTKFSKTINLQQLESNAAIKKVKLDSLITILNKIEKTLNQESINFWEENVDTKSGKYRNLLQELITASHQFKNHQKYPLINAAINKITPFCSPSWIVEHIILGKSAQKLNINYFDPFNMDIE